MSKMHCLFYDSIKEFMEDVKEKPKTFRKSAHENYWKTWSESSGGFHGNFNSAYKKWKEHNVTQEASMLAGVMDEINCADFEERAWEFRQRLEEGDIIDVNRYLDGHEKFWCGVRRAWRAKQVVRIYCGVGGNCNRSKQELAVCGAAAITLCEILESMGIGVEVWGTSPSSGLFTNGDNGMTLIKLKGSDEFADLGIINFIAGNDTVFRNGVFRSWVKLGERDDLTCESDLGHMREPTAKNIGLSDDEANAAIIMPQLFDVNTARTWLLNLIKAMPEKLGGKKKKEVE